MFRAFSKANCLLKGVIAESVRGVLSGVPNRAHLLVDPPGTASICDPRPVARSSIGLSLGIAPNLFLVLGLVLLGFPPTELDWSYLERETPGQGLLEETPLVLNLRRRVR